MLEMLVCEEIKTGNHLNVFQDLYRAAYIDSVFLRDCVSRNDNCSKKLEILSSIACNYPLRKLTMVLL